MLCANSFAQDVEQRQRTLITKRTASWCGNCGTWGWAFMEALIEDNDGKAVLVAAHFSGDLANQISTDITNNFGGVGQPNFFVENERLPAGSSTWSNFRTQTKDFVDMNFEAEPIVNTGLSATMNSNGNLAVTAKSKFFQDTDGEYLLGVYVLENNLINNQSGQGANANHKKVLVASATADSFGDVIANDANIMAGTEVMNEYVISGLDANNAANYELIAIVWKLENGFRKFENVFSVAGPNFEAPVGVRNALNASAYNVSPNLSADLVNVKLNVDKAQNASVKLYNLNGQLVQSIFEGVANARMDFNISKNELGISNGTYIININIDGKTATEKVVFID